MASHVHPFSGVREAECGEEDSAFAASAFVSEQLDTYRCLVARLEFTEPFSLCGRFLLLEGDVPALSAGSRVFERTEHSAELVAFLFATLKITKLEEFGCFGSSCLGAIMAAAPFLPRAGNVVWAPTWEQTQWSPPAEVVKSLVPVLVATRDSPAARGAWDAVVALQQLPSSAWWVSQVAIEAPHLPCPCQCSVDSCTRCLSGRAFVGFELLRNSPS